MKKYIGFLIVLSLFVLGARDAKALISPESPCASNASPTITILSPNGGEVYQPGKQIEVKWKSCNVNSNENLQIGLYVDIGNNYGVITSSMYSNTGHGIINIPLTNYTNSNAVSDKYIVMISSYNLGINTKSNIFTIKTQNAEVAPTIKVISPNGGEKYITGQQITIKWNSTGIPVSDKVVIVLDPSPETNAMGQDGYNMSGSDGTLNDGIETHTLSSGVYGKFKVRVLRLNNKDIKDVSDDYFTIAPLVSSDCPSTASPSVTVLSPNGGENYMIGGKMEVRWSNCRVSLESSDIVISLHQDGEWVNVVYLTNGTLNDGSEIFTIPNINPGSYKIRVGTSSAVVGQDYSDNLFAINSLPISSMLPAGCNSSVGFSSTNGLPCFLDTNSATSITKNTVVLNGRLIANAPSDVYFKYKKAGNWNEMLYTHKTSQQTNGLFAHTLSNLLPSTSYEFMACTDYLGEKRCAKLLTFTTLSSSEIQEEEIVDQKSVYLAGCSSSEGYSYITGVKCSSCSVSGAGCGAVATSAMVRKTLKQGIKDEEVKILQSFLNIKADGSFGPQTASAVKLFQAQKGLTPDGVVGPKTWTFINK